MSPGLIAALVTALAPPGSGNAGDELARPTPVEAAGKVIDVDVGHAAPFVGDFDGDGVKDLLVGQFGDGKLRVYRNAGTDAAPRFEAVTWFRGGREDGRVPAG
jgi:hypothetical protein